MKVKPARIDMRSFNRAVRGIERMARRGDQANVSGLRVIGEMIMADIKDSRSEKGVPVDTGVLRASGRVTGPDAAGVVRLTFGGASAAYALRQHEVLSYRHTVGEARYLVRGVERFVADVKQTAILHAMADKAAGIGPKRNTRGRFTR
jgi:hypothetical protein